MNTKQEFELDDVLANHQLCNQTSGETEWYTPPNIIEAARLAMRGIDLDPASSKDANTRVRAAEFYTKFEDGLRRNWHGRVWLNHPFSREGNGPWIRKLVEEFRSRRVVEACSITYAATSEGWFQPLLHFPQCFLFPRTNYLLPDGSVKPGVTKGSVVTYLGPNLGRFAQAFSHLGKVKVEFPISTEQQILQQDLI